MGLALVGLCLASSVALAAPARVLLTAFGEFGGEPDNASRAMMTAFLRSLDRQPLLSEATVEALVLPVVYGKAEQMLELGIRAARPDLVISFGQAPGREFRLERLARNRDSTTIPDNEGKGGSDPIMRGGPAQLETGLALERIREKLRAGRFRAVMSENAGNYLCNHLFYLLMHLARETRGAAGRPLVAGFVHVPALPGGAGDYETWGEKNAGAIRAVVEASIEAWNAGSGPVDPASLSAFARD